MRFSFGFVIVAALALASCQLVDRQRAIDLAVRNVGADASLLDARLGRLGDFPGFERAEFGRDTPVWAVTFAGQFAGECVLQRNLQPSCPPVANRATVFVDARGEEVIAASYRLEP